MSSTTLKGEGLVTEITAAEDIKTLFANSANFNQLNHFIANSITESIAIVFNGDCD